MQALQFIECVAERDIDLLLLEELHVSAAFREWFVAQVFGVGVRVDRFLGAWHSITHASLGESDLILMFESNLNQRSAVLIENKIDAMPQPEQAERYRLRGGAGIRDGDWATFQTCITAPDAYLMGTPNTQEYDARISYESIREWFTQLAPRDTRSDYKARLLQEGIEQNRRGYQAVPHPAVTRFWADYWRIASAEYPQLGMKKPGRKPAGSCWIQFRPSGLVNARCILHKLTIGAVDLELPAAGNMVEEMAATNRAILSDGFEVVKTTNSASIRVGVPKLDLFAEMDPQIEAVRAGLSAAATLLAISPRIEMPAAAV